MTNTSLNDFPPSELQASVLVACHTAVTSGVNLHKPQGMGEGGGREGRPWEGRREALGGGRQGGVGEGGGRQGGVGVGGGGDKRGKEEESSRNIRIFIMSRRGLTARNQEDKWVGRYKAEW